MLDQFAGEFQAIRMSELRNWAEEERRALKVRKNRKTEKVNKEGEIVVFSSPETPVRCPDPKPSIAS